jgi:hypothetical protein
MPVIQLSQFLSCIFFGKSFKSPFTRASSARAAISLQSIHHIGFSLGSMMSSVFAHRLSGMGLGFIPRYNPKQLKVIILLKIYIVYFLSVPSSSSFFNTAFRASKRFIPWNSDPPTSVIAPWSVNNSYMGKLCLFPHS